MSVPLSNGDLVEVEVTEGEHGCVTMSRAYTDASGTKKKTCTVTCSNGKSHTWNCNSNQSCVGDCSDPENPKGSCS